MARPIQGPPAPGEDPEFDRMVELEMQRRAGGNSVNGATLNTTQEAQQTAEFEAEVAAEMRRLEANLRKEAGVAPLQQGAPQQGAPQSLGQAPPQGAPPRQFQYPPHQQAPRHQPPTQFQQPAPSRSPRRNPMAAAQDHLGVGLAPDRQHDFSEPGTDRYGHHVYGDQWSNRHSKDHFRSGAGMALRQGHDSGAGVGASIGGNVGSGHTRAHNPDAAIAAFLNAPKAQSTAGMGFGRGVATLEGLGSHRNKEKQQQYALELQGQIAMEQRKKEAERQMQLRMSRDRLSYRNPDPIGYLSPTQPEGGVGAGAGAGADAGKMPLYPAASAGSGVGTGGPIGNHGPANVGMNGPEALATGTNHQTGAALSAEVMDVARRASRRRDENAEHAKNEAKLKQQIAYREELRRQMEEKKEERRRQKEKDEEFDRRYEQAYANVATSGAGATRGGGAPVDGRGPPNLDIGVVPPRGRRDPNLESGQSPDHRWSGAPLGPALGPSSGGQSQDQGPSHPRHQQHQQPLPQQPPQYANDGSDMLAGSELAAQPDWSNPKAARERLVADVYGAGINGMGGSGDGGPGLNPNDPEAAKKAAKARSVMGQRAALEAQMAEKRRMKEIAEKKERDEDLREARKAAEEERIAKEAIDRSNQQRRMNEQAELDRMYAEQDKAVNARKHGKHSPAPGAPGNGGGVGNVQNSPTPNGGPGGIGGINGSGGRVAHSPQGSRSGPYGRVDGGGMSPTKLNFSGSPGQRRPNPNATPSESGGDHPPEIGLLNQPGSDMGPSGPLDGAGMAAGGTEAGGSKFGGQYGQDQDFEAMVRAEMEKLRPQPPRGVTWGPGVNGSSEMEPPYPPATQHQPGGGDNGGDGGGGRGKWPAPYVPHGQSAVDDSLEMGGRGDRNHNMASPDPMEKSMAAESFFLPRDATTTTPTGGGVGSAISHTDANPYDPQVVGGRFAGVGMPGVNLPLYQAAAGSLKSHSVHTEYTSNSPGPGGARGAQEERSFPRQQAAGQGFSLSRGTGGLEEIDAFVDNWQRDHPIAGGGVPGITSYGVGATTTGLSPRILGKDSQLVEQSLGGESMLMYLRQMEAAEAKARGADGGGGGAGGSEMYAHLGGLSPDDPFAQLAAARPPSVGVGYGHGSGLGGDGDGVGGLVHGGGGVEGASEGRHSPLQGLLRDHPEVKTRDVRADTMKTLETVESKATIQTGELMSQPSHLSLESVEMVPKSKDATQGETAAVDEHGMTAAMRAALDAVEHNHTSVKGDAGGGVAPVGTKAAEVVEEDCDHVLFWLRCDKLRKCDRFSKSDPFVVIIDKDTEHEYGRTEIIQDNHEPVFDTPIKMPFLPDQVQRIRIEVRDDDGKNGQKYEIIGSVGQKVSKLVTKWPPEEVQLQLPILHKNKPAGNVYLRPQAAPRRARPEKAEADRPLTGKGSVGEKAAAAAAGSDERAQLEAEAKLDEAVRMVTPRTSQEQGGDAAGASRHFDVAAAQANTAGAARVAALANMDSAVASAAAMPEYHHRRAPEAGWYGEAKLKHQQLAALNPTGGFEPPMQHGELYRREIDELRYERQSGGGDEVIVAASTEMKAGAAEPFSVQRA